jgi:DNA repair exonuclease SbcCD nuclease subunit
MRPHLLNEGGAELFRQARLDAVRLVGQFAADRGCEFVLVAGDVFESNQVDRRTVVQGLEAMASIRVPTYLLPGNHDPFDPGSVYRSETFSAHRPDNVEVLGQPGLVELKPGLALVAAPWASKRPATDLVADACRNVEPTPGLRILVGHGAVSSFEINRDNPATIQVTALEEALRTGCLHYAALGDRHSVTEVGERVWYSGSPEATDFGEVASGYALLVELSDDSCSVERLPTGRWRFLRQEFDLASQNDLETLRGWLTDQPQKERTILRLGLTGTVTLGLKAQLDQLLEEQRELFAAIDWWETESDLVVLPDEGDFGPGKLSGFAEEARKRLMEQAQLAAEEGERERARASLALLYRLAGAGE